LRDIQHPCRKLQVQNFIAEPFERLPVSERIAAELCEPLKLLIFAACTLPLLNDDLLLLGIHTALRRLRSDRDYGFSGGQGWSEVMELPVRAYDGNLAAIHHDASPALRLPRHLNYVAVLDKR